MYIYLTEVADSTSVFTFPSLPESIAVQGNAKYQNYDILGQGTVMIPKGTDATSISWDGVLFGKSRRKHSFVKNWIAPRECQNILNKWRENGTVLRLLVTESNINYDVTIQSLTFHSLGASGDIEYDVSFNLKRDLKIFTTDELNIAAPVEPRPEPAPPAGETYTVVSGDNLWAIARKKLGNATRWTEIYEMNKDVIEANAKKRGKASSNNGWWIWPGDVYTLPAP